MYFIRQSSSFLQGGITALLMASGEGHFKVVQLLVDAGALVDVQEEVRNYLQAHQ